jgi:hypothetical protein
MVRLKAAIVKKIPNLINSITVKYYRSINSQKIRECRPINVITGPNDVGKSNLLRALNLFFNEENELGEDLVFQDEFSHSRLDSVRRESIKGRQFIQIEVEFNCQSSFKKTLPPKFRVRKTWFRESFSPNLSHDLEQHIKSGSLATTITKAEGSLQRFLNSIVFTYIPAIKDRDIFQTVLGDLQSALFSQSEAAGGGFADDIKRFSADLEKQALELRSDFSKLTGVDTRVTLPSSYTELFQAFDVRTSGAYEESVSLDHRGDGVRVRFLPAILNYIAERSRKLHVWGFEEPENSMEYKRAFELATTMAETYSKNAQIFLTTHSPAFIDLTRQNQSIYMASRKNSDTVFTHLNSKKWADAADSDPMLMIADELGHIRLMSELREKLEERISTAENVIRTASAATEALSKIQRPVVLTEGKTDAQILVSAWKKLRGADAPFDIKSCNVLTPDEPSDAAGATQLAICLRSIMADHPHTVIGLFDRDAEGEKAWKMDANFIQDDLFSDVKTAKNKKAHAMLLPVPDGGDAFAKSGNLCMEFLFSADDLSKKVDGKGIVLDPIPVILQCGGTEISRSMGSELWQMRIKDGKTHFAEKVVPTLPKESFVAFEKIFSVVETIIAAETQQT